MDSDTLVEVYQLVSEYSEVDERVSTPDGLDDFDYRDIIDPTNVIASGDARVEGGTLHATARGATGEDGYEFSRINATGGTYGDVRVFLTIDLTAEFSGDDVELDELETGRVVIEGEVEVTNGRRHSGETPPF